MWGLVTDHLPRLTCHDDGIALVVSGGKAGMYFYISLIG